MSTASGSQHTFESDGKDLIEEYSKEVLVIMNQISTYSIAWL